MPSKKETTGTSLSTWSFTPSSSDTIKNVTTTEQLITCPTYYINASYNGGSSEKKYAFANATVRFMLRDASLAVRTYSQSVRLWDRGTSKQLSPSSSGINIDAGDIFDSQNPTTKTVYIQRVLVKATTFSGDGMTANASEYYGSMTSEEIESPFGNAMVVKYACKPTGTVTNSGIDTDEAYTGKTKYTVRATDLTAYYGGYITSAKLVIGDQVDEIAVDRLHTANLSIDLDTAGTFTPQVIITDSREASREIDLSQLTVSEYNAPSANCAVQRALATGKLDDDGTNVLVTANITYADGAGTFEEPTVTVTDENVTESANITWYESWNASSGVSSAIDWNNYDPTSPVTIYGLVTGYGNTTGFSTSKSFQITVTPRDSYQSGTAVTQTLATAFYTIDFLAGGHGIAFGMPASQDGFECGMDTIFHDSVVVDDTLDVSGAVTMDSTLDVGGDVDIASTALYKIGGTSLIDILYPIGSCYTTSTNTNPSTWLGGTWSLIDKQFSPASGTNGITWNSTNTRDYDSDTKRTFDWTRSGHTVWIRLRWYNKVAMTDDTTTIATINMATLGSATAGYYQYQCAVNDGINGVALTSMLWSGTTLTISTVDVVTRATSIPTTTNNSNYATFSIQMNLSDMANTACNQFVWQRTQ